MHILASEPEKRSDIKILPPSPKRDMHNLINITEADCENSYELKPIEAIQCI